MGNELEGKGYIHATHQDMSKFDSRRETGYVRVANVIQDFVAEATEAVEDKRLPRSIPTAGKYTSISNTNPYDLLPLVEKLCWKFLRC